MHQASQWRWHLAGVCVEILGEMQSLSRDGPFGLELGMAALHNLSLDCT
jgi:hypothetical protein